MQAETIYDIYYKEEKMMKTLKRLVSLTLTMLLVAGLCAACAQETVEIHNPEDVKASSFQSSFSDKPIIDEVFLDEGEFVDIAPEMVPLSSAPAVSTVLTPSAPGTATKKNDKAEIDYSNSKDGYIMIKYLKQTTKPLKVLVTGPSTTRYQYNLKSNGSFEVFPLSDGSGDYKIDVCEQVDGGKYAISNTASIKVTLTDDKAPFLRPNQYVNFKSDSEVVKKAAELVKDKSAFNDKIAAIYSFVVKNFTYDKELANNVKEGYLPDVDAVLAKKKGICFDYAAVMTAMLRSQGIPTKLVLGYAGEVYHAWISVFSDKEGWIESVIYFDGKSWKLMDPTFASTGKESAEAMKYIGDGKNYSAKYLY